MCVGGGGGGGLTKNHHSFNVDCESGVNVSISYLPLCLVSSQTRAYQSHTNAMIPTKINLFI